MEDGYVTNSFQYPRPQGSGCYIININHTINAGPIQYLFIKTRAYRTCTNTGGFYWYCSVGSSQTTVITSDSGVGQSAEATVASSANLTTEFYIRVNMTSCTRTGYLKFGLIRSGTSSSGGTYGSDDYVRIRVYSPLVYNEQPTSSNSEYQSAYGYDITVT